MKKWIFVDLETTGATAARDRITEIGLVEVDGDRVSRWSTLINPQMPIPPFIQQLTGIDDAMVADAPTFGQVAEPLLARLQDAVFVAHNARFDHGFLHHAFRQTGMDLKCEVLCTVKLSRALFPEQARHNLDALIARHGLLADGRHRALADADLIWQFWNKLNAQVPPEQLDQAVRQQLRRPALPPQLAPDALDGIPDGPGVYLFHDEANLPLYAGRAARLREQVSSHFIGTRRAPEGAPFARQVHRIEWHGTAGEVGAQLLEARLIRQLLPKHNRMARRPRDLCAWQLRPADDGWPRPVLTRADQLDFGRADCLYGLFHSKRAADTALRELARQHELCPVCLGMESRQPDQPCSAYPLHRCRGACIGAEAGALHQARVEAALNPLKLKPWPYPSAIGLIETGEDGRQEMHVVHNWCWLGTAVSEEDLWSLLDEAPAAPAFDHDTYQIATRALSGGRVRVRPLPRGRPE